MTTDPTAALHGRARTDGGAPLVTHYGPAGERTELSVASFANWVAKTTNLLDELGLDEDASVLLPVLTQRPAHWMPLIWPFALWQAGLPAVVTTGGPAAGLADLTVVGPHAARAEGDGATMACSLDPWGRPLQDLPHGVLDFSAEALAQPDAALARPAGPSAPAWVDADRSVTVHDLGLLQPLPRRVLARPTTAWGSVSLLVRAIIGGGSLVLVESDADDAALAASERAALLD